MNRKGCGSFDFCNYSSCENQMGSYLQHAHNISANLFHQGSTSPHAELQPLNRAVAIFPQTLALVNSRLFQGKFFTSRTPSSQRQDRLSSQLNMSSLLLFQKRTPTLAFSFPLRCHFYHTWQYFCRLSSQYFQSAPGNMLN